MISLIINIDWHSTIYNWHHMLGLWETWWTPTKYSPKIIVWKTILILWPTYLLFLVHKLVKYYYNIHVLGESLDRMLVKWSKRYGKVVLTILKVHLNYFCKDSKREVIYVDVILAKFDTTWGKNNLPYHKSNCRIMWNNRVSNVDLVIHTLISSPFLRFCDTIGCIQEIPDSLFLIHSGLVCSLTINYGLFPWSQNNRPPSPKRFLGSM